MQLAHMDYVLDDALDRFDFARCQGWLTRAYWSEGIGEGEVRLGFSNSTLVVGAYRDGVQVACLRLISDRVRFAYLMDVFVDEQHRGLGLARALVQFVLDHPAMKYVVKWTLATHDAHEVYRQVGFFGVARRAALDGARASARVDRRGLTDAAYRRPALHGRREALPIAPQQINAFSA